MKGQIQKFQLEERFRKLEKENRTSLKDKKPIKPFNSKSSITVLENENRSNLLNIDKGRFEYDKRDLGKELNSSSKLVAKICLYRLKTKNKGKPYGYVNE